jgi:hypothetical protein
MLTRRRAKAEAQISSTQTPSWPAPPISVPGAPKKRQRVLESPEIESVVSVVMLITNATEDDPKKTTLKFIRSARIDAQIREFFFVYRRLSEDDYSDLTPLMVNKALIFSTLDDAKHTGEEPMHAKIRAELQAAYPDIWESVPKGTSDPDYPTNAYNIPCRLPVEWRVERIVPFLNGDRLFYSNEITKDGDFVR